MSWLQLASRNSSGAAQDERPIAFHKRTVRLRLRVYSLACGQRRRLSARPAIGVPVAVARRYSSTYVTLINHVIQCIVCALRHSA